MKAGLHKSQDGIIAIFSVMIIMGILTLLTIGFSAITRQAQRRTLDDVLSMQAYYAAETGINRLSAIADEIIDENTTCEDTANALDPSYRPNFTRELDPENGIDVPCLLVDNSAQDIRDSVPTDEPVVMELKHELGRPIERIEIEWDSADLDNPEPLPDFATPVFTPLASWRSGGRSMVGVVRVDLVPYSQAHYVDRQHLINNVQTIYLYPTTNVAGTTDMINPLPGVNNQSSVNLVRCSDSLFNGYRCRAMINTNDDGYYIRISSYYSDISFVLTPYESDTGEVIANLTVGQTMIDATGRAADVLRRIQVRLESERLNRLEAGHHEMYALLSAYSVCKRLAAMPGGTTVDSAGLPGWPAGGDPACALP